MFWSAAKAKYISSLNQQFQFSIVHNSSKLSKADLFISKSTIAPKRQIKGLFTPVVCGSVNIESMMLGLTLG